MRKLLFLFVAIILVFSINVFGQNQRKKKNYNLPEADDEVLVAFRKKQEKPKISHRRKSTKRKVKPFFDEADALFGKRSRKSSRKKYANQEVSYRKKSKSKIKKGVTHDPEFENWANRKRKIKKQEK